MALLEWTERANPFDGDGGQGVVYAPGLATTFWDGVSCPILDIFASCWSPALHMFVVVGIDGTGNPAIGTSVDGGATWSQPDNPFTQGDNSGDISAVAWSPLLNLFVAAGDRGDLTVTVATSPDGATWTPQSCPLDSYGSAVAWSPQLNIFVVAGSNADQTILIVTSPDGITWTAQSTPWDDGVSGVDGLCSSPITGALVVAAGQAHSGDGPSIMISPDGATWTEHTTPFDTGTDGLSSNVTYATAYAKLFAVGQNFDTGGLTLISSSDGVTWAHVPNPFDGDHSDFFASAVTQGPDGHLFVSGEAPWIEVVSSADGGVTWKTEATAHDIDEDGIFTLCYSPDLNVLLGGGQAGSSDSVSLRGATSLGLFVAVGQLTSGAVIQISGDGINWMPRGNVSSTMSYAQCVEWAPELGLFVIGGLTFSSQALMASSPDGLAWEVGVNPFAPGHFSVPWSIAWSGSQMQFVAVATFEFTGTTGGASIATSPDGVTWTRRPSNFDALASGAFRVGSGRGVCFSRDLDLWVAVGQIPVGGDGAITLNSPDGVTWTFPEPHSGIGIGTLFVVAWITATQIFVAVGVAGTYTSPDGITWTKRTSPLDGGTPYAWGITQGSGKIIVAGSNAAVTSTLVESTDGETWADDTSSPFNTGSGSGAMGVTYAEELALLVAVGSETF